MASGGEAGSVLEGRGQRGSDSVDAFDARPFAFHARLRAMAFATAFVMLCTVVYVGPSGPTPFAKAQAALEELIAARDAASRVVQSLQALAASAGAHDGEDDVPMTAATAPAEGADVALTQEQLDAAAAQATSEWLASRPGSDLSALTFAVEDLPDLRLGSQSGTTIAIDPYAAGHGWTVAYPEDPDGRMDLLTVVRHEIGHYLGYDHGPGLMSETLAPGDAHGVPPSAWAIGAGGVATASASGALDHTLRHDAAGQRIELVAANGTVDPLRLAGVSAIVVAGGAGDDRLTLGSSSYPVPVAFDGGAGSDELVGPAIDTTWTVSGANAGTVVGVTFTNVENLTGAADNQDHFSFASDAEVDGVVEGGAGGFDTVAVDVGGHTVTYAVTGADSGVISWGTRSVVFSGMEPVQLTGTTNLVYAGTAGDDTIIIEDIADTGPCPRCMQISGSGELVTFSAPTGTDTLTINGGGGADRIEWKSTDAGFTGTLTINGGGDAGDTLVVTRNVNMTLSNAQLVLPEKTATISGFTAAELTGGAGNNTLDASAFSGSVVLDGQGGNDTLKAGSGGGTLKGGLGNDHLYGGAGDDVLEGGAGDDTYYFDDAYGTDTIVENAGGGTDTIDLTALLAANMPTVSVDNKVFTSGAHTITQTGTELVEEINVDLAAGAKSAVETAFTNLATYVTELKSTVHQLSNALALLDRGAANDLERLVGLIEAFEQLRDAANAAISGAPTTLSDVIAALNGVAFPAPWGSITFSTSYRGATADGKLEVLIDIDLPATVVAKTVDLDLGTKGEELGLVLDTSAADGVQPPTFSVSTTITAAISIGVLAGTTTVFLVPGGHIRLDLSASASLPNPTTINLSFLEATINGASVTFSGSVDLALKDPTPGDGRIGLAELVASPIADRVTVTEPGVQTLNASVAVSLASGVELLGGGNLASATFTAALAGNLFGGSGTPPTVDYTFTADGATDLLNSFGNIGPQEVFGMLQSLMNGLTSVSGVDVFNTAIPFTGKTVGEVMDYATAFKTKVLDPLFVSGDILRPDDDGDGVVDFAFSSIQGLIDKLRIALGLPASFKALYDPATNELKFTISLDQILAFGDVKVGVAVPGGGGNNEKQTLTVNGVATGGLLPDTFRLAFPDANGALEFTAPIALGAAASGGAGSVQSRLEALSGIGAGNVVVTAGPSPATYTVEFVGALANTDVATLVSDARNLAGLFSFDFGAALGDLAGLSTNGKYTIVATLHAGLTFGIDLDPSQAIEITPAVYAPVIDIAVSVPVGATGNAVQILSIRNVNGGSFTLFLDLNKNGNADPGETTADIAFNPDETVGTAASLLQTRLNALAGVSTAVTLEKFGNLRIYTITFATPSSPARLVAIPTNLTGPTTNGRLTANATFDVTIVVPAVQVSDGTNAAQNLAQTTTVVNNITVNRSATTGNTSIADLGDDVQAAVNLRLAALGLTLGFVHQVAVNGLSLLATGPVGAGAHVDATHNPFTQMQTDLPFTIVLKTNGGTVEKKVQGKLRLVDVLDAAASKTNRSLFNPDGTLNAAELTAAIPIARLAERLQAAVQEALNGAGFGGFTVSVTVIGVAPNQRLRFAVTAVPTAGDTVDVQFRSPIRVDAGGGRVSLSTSSVTISLLGLDAGVTVDRRLEIDAGGFESAAFQELGISSSPTRLSGTTTRLIKFTMVIDGTHVEVTLAAATRTSVTQLRDDLQTQVSAALTAAALAPDLVEVFIVGQETGIIGNRIGLRAKAGAVSSFSIQVPIDVDTSTAGIQLNGAITELGWQSGSGETRRARATQFFMENVSLTGTVAVILPNVTVNANIGFLEITATGHGTLPVAAPANRFFDATIDFAFVDPVTGGDRVTLDVIVNALKQGKFFFVTAGGTTASPGTGFVRGEIGGGLGVAVDISPGAGLSGLGSLDAHLSVTAHSPDWARAPPTFSDPYGFGTSPTALGGTAFALATTAPANGRLTHDITFVISQTVSGTLYEVAVRLRASDTAAFNSRAELQTALQAEIDRALALLVVKGGSGGTITVAITGAGEIQLTASATDPLHVRSTKVDIQFTGPDIAAVLEKFKDLSFATILQGLQLLVDFLHSLAGTGGAGSAIVDILDTKLPLVDRSISELIDTANQLAQKLDQILQNPTASIQALETLIRTQLNIPAIVPPVLSWDALNQTIAIDFSFATSVHLSRPFSLALDDPSLGLPSWLTSIVSVSASGNLDLTASVQLDVKLGLDLEGPDKAFFLKVGDTGTKLTAIASAVGTGLAFDAKLGPFGLFVSGGTASLGLKVTAKLLDADGDGRLVLVAYGDGSATTDLTRLGAFVNLDLTTPANSSIVIEPAPGLTCSSGKFVCATLPLYVGTADNLIPIDFGTANPGAPEPGATVPAGFTTGPDHALRVVVDLTEFLSPGGGSGFHFQLPDFDFANFQLPSIFALLSDPSTLIDGLDRLIGVIQDAVQGQILGIKLPLIGDALANNPASNLLGELRAALLQPLATLLRENNANLETLVDLIKTTINNALTSVGLLQSAVVQSGVNPANPFDTTPYIQFDFDIGKTIVVDLGAVDFDLGIPALGISGKINPKVSLTFSIKFGFGVDQNLGFYFATHHTPEMHVSVKISLSDVACPAGTVTRAQIEGRLLFLALKLVDGVDLDGDHVVEVNCGSVTPGTQELSTLFFQADVDIVDPSGDGKLTIGELVSGSLSSIVRPSLSGGALLRAQATVDFSILDAGLAKALPKMTTDLLVDFVLSASPATGFVIAPPQVILANITLDLGEFISGFAKPILDQIKAILEPLEFLIGPDGFLNARIPLLSDLAGRTITGKDLVQFFDPDNGPTIVAFLNFVEQLYNLIDLVETASSEGTVLINFGDLVLSGGSTNFGSFIDKPINVGGASADLRKMSTLKDVSLPDPSTLAGLMTQQGSAGGATQKFTAGVSGTTSIDFPILKPENLIKLFLGQDVTLVLITLPHLGFDFFYRQEFPIIGPLVGFFGGGVSAGIDLGFGYDTKGIRTLIETGSPAALLDGFFINDLDPVTGVDRPEAFLSATISVGAGISLGLVKAGVEGGITATITFNLADLDGDGKIRISELAQNVLANDGNPLAVFDISGVIEFFLRAFVEINLFITKITLNFEFVRLKLFEFNIDFNRPANLASLANGVLTLHIGPNAPQRLIGDITDGNETIFVKSSGSDVCVWAPQFGRPEAAAQCFAGVTRIVANGGAGNDTIDLQAMTLTGVVAELRGGDGNDTIYGGSGNDFLYGDAGDDHLYGGPGNDQLFGGLGNDFLYGQDGNDVLDGGEGDDTLDGGAHDDTYIGGPGDDTYVRSTGNDTFSLADFGSVDTITGTEGGTLLDFSGMATNLTYFLSSSGIQVGYDKIAGTAGTSIAHFNSQLIVVDPGGIEKIIGGDLVDTFFVTGATGGIILDGGKGNDRYVFYVGSSAIAATVNDQGDPWNSDNVIEIVGTSGADTITVTSTTITLNTAPSQVVTYVAPAAGANVLQIKVFGHAGDDTITITSTSATVPVRVDAGAGNDKVVVGGGTGLDDIRSLSQPGLNPPFGLGPIVLVGGAPGANEHDTVVIDDSSDATGEGGSLTAFLEQRVGIVDPVEVGVVTGLGMKLYVDSAALAANNHTMGRIEFEGFETVEVKLGGGTKTFTIGGDALLGNDPSDLPQVRQDNVVQFVNTPTAMKVIVGGSGDDTFQLLATNQLERGTDTDVLNATLHPSLNLVSTATTTNGVAGTTSEVQTLTVSAAARGSGYFTLRLRHEETKPIPFGASAADIQAALRNFAQLTTSAIPNPVTVTGGPTSFTITFHQDFGNLEQLVARIVPLLIDAAGGDDTLRVQGLYEDFFFKGGAGTDRVNLNVDAVTGDQLGVERVVAKAVVATLTNGGGGTNEIQRITFVDVVGGTFRVTFGGFTTPWLGWDTSAALLKQALENLPGIDAVTVVKNGNVYEIEFLGALAGLDVAQLIVDGANLLTNGMNAIVTVDGEGGDDVYNVYLIGANTNSLINVFDSGTSGLNAKIPPATVDFDRLTVWGTDDPSHGDWFLLRASTSDKGLAFIALINAPDPNNVQDGDPVERVNYNLNLEKITIEGQRGDDQFYIDDTRAPITINGGDGNDFFQVGQLYKSRRTPELAGVAPEDVFATIETTKGWLSNGISVPMTINGDDGEDYFIVFHNLAVLTLNGGNDDDTFLIQAFALAGSQEDKRALTDLSGDAGADLIQYAVNAPVNINGGDGFDTVIIIGTEFGDDFVITKDGVYGAGLNVNFINIEFLEVDGAEGDDRFFVISTGINFQTIITGGLGTDLISVQGPTPANGVISNDLLGHSGIITHGVESSVDPSEYSGLKVVGISANVADNDEAGAVIVQSNGYSQIIQGATRNETAQGVDSYQVMLTRPPLYGELVIVQIDVPVGIVYLSGATEIRDVDDLALGLSLCFDNGGGQCVAAGYDGTVATRPLGGAWYKPQTVTFTVDDLSAHIPDIADIQHRIVVSDAPAGTVSGAVVSAMSIDPDTSVKGDEYSVLVASGSPFAVPTAALPEGLRGATLKITGGDDEAAGQLRLILGTYRATVTVNATGGTFTLSLFGQTTAPIAYNASAATVHAALVALDAIGPGGVVVTKAGNTWTLELRGERVFVYDYVNNAVVKVNTGGLTGFTSAPVVIDANSIKLNRPWSVQPSGGALFEISLFSAVQLPNVRVRIYSAATPEIVLDQTGGSTSVAEGTNVGPAVDTVRVRLSSEPTSTVTVTLTGMGQLDFSSSTLTFTTGNWNVFQTVQVSARHDLVVEGFHKADLVLTATSTDNNYNNLTVLTVVDIADDDHPGVRVIESNGSTNVIEVDLVHHGIPGGDLADVAARATDYYDIVLTKQPGVGETVTVTAIAEPTRTSRTGGIRSFTRQLRVCLVTGAIDCSLDSQYHESVDVTFDHDDWDTPKRIMVRAVDDRRVDGMDTKVFAPQLDLLNNIQGPLFIRGGLGTDRTGLLEREPLMLPGERNEKPSMGSVVSATEADEDEPAKIVIDPTTLATVTASVAPGHEANREVQRLAVNATGGTYTLTYNGSTTDPLPFDATALDIELALEAIGTGDVTVSANSSVFKITFLTPGVKHAIVADDVDLQPLQAEDLIDFTIEITAGAGKNKIRIITGAVALDATHWELTLDKPWLSPFTGDATVPDATSEFTLVPTNPNLLVKEETQADILWVFDADNPSSYNDPNAPGGNPYGEGRLFFDSSLYGEKVAIGTKVNGGEAGRNEIQSMLVLAIAGTFTLSFAGQTTAPIAWDADAAAIQAALEALPNIGVGDVVVTKPGDRFEIEFTGALGGTDQPKMRANTALLTGGKPLDAMRLTGFGMGADRTIAGAPLPGGITFEEIENFQLVLGSGANKLDVDDTHEGLTRIDTGAGDDVVNVRRIAGHTVVNLGAGSDVVNVHNLDQKLSDLLGLLTVMGDVPRAEVVTLAKGSPAEGTSVDSVDEIQRLTIDATGGTFTLTFDGHTTAPIAYNASAAAVHAALVALPNVPNPTDIQVRKAGNVYRITFTGALGAQDIPLLSANSAGLTNGAGATDTLNVKDANATANDWALLTSSSLTGLSMVGPNEIQQVVVDATAGSFTLSFEGETTAVLPFDVSAAAMQAALEALATIGAGNVSVTKNDDVYVIRFQGFLTNADVEQIVATSIDLAKTLEHLGGALVTSAGTVTATTRVHGFDEPAVNDLQVLTVGLTSGTYTLTLPIAEGQFVTTAPIPFDASAEMVRQAIQDAVAQGDDFAALKFDVTVDRYENVYLVNFQGHLRQVNGGLGVGFLVPSSPLVTVTTRMDGINYYGIEIVNIDAGSGAQVFNVQGTTAGSTGFALGGGVAVTNVRLHDGDDRVFVSSNADLDHASWNGFDFLTGNLDDVRGALNLDLGVGRHRIFVSDEAATAGDPNVVITDTAASLPAAPAALGLATDAEIWITGLAPAGISYKVAPAGNLFDGVVYWTGSGDDGVTIDGTHHRPAVATERTTTLLNTGLGNDTITVTLTNGQDGFFVLHTMGGAKSANPALLTGGETDDDVVNAAGSTLPLIVFGGLGDDTITAGMSGDIVFGDFGRVQYGAPAGVPTATYGFGGRGDVISSQVVDPRWVISRHLELGGIDVIKGLAGEDILIGGAGSGGTNPVGAYDDYIDGGAHDDLIFGDAVELYRRDTNPAVVGDITNPRFQTLTGGQIYSIVGGESSGAALVDGIARDYRDPDGAPSWAEYVIVNLFHTAAIEAAGGNSFGNDYIAGGPGHDVIFGQLGDDVIQGDGSIDGALAGNPVGAYRVPAPDIALTPTLTVPSVGTLVVNPSFEAATDGDDYIEGGGGADVIFGGLGQDDIIGGSSSLFTLVTAAMRPDGADIIFGGSGERIDRNHEVEAGADFVAVRHARDADTIVGDNGNIIRVVGTNGVDSGWYPRFNYDSLALGGAGYSAPGGLAIIPRAVVLLDYTPGGPDFRPDLFPGFTGDGCGTDIGGGDEIHGESGDDTMYGGCGDDILFGDSEDDDIIGGWGNDWMSGGTGSDGMLGDDGRIFTSRNTTVGEPLNGIAGIPTSQQNLLIYTPGKLQQAVINVTNALKKTVDLTPFNLTPNALGADDPLFVPQYADDIMYGGWGDDFMHGGAGDDAMSGAEALAIFFSQPTNPGDVLGFGAVRAGEFRDYDEYDPMRRLQPFLLDFDHAEGPLVAGSTTIRTDGNDVLFGDLGNDWIVGGTGRDHMYGGWGNDLLDADDDKSTNGGANDLPDTHPSYEDIAFGGAGLDVLIGNTGGDRLIDWVGEFNSFLVPFAPFGAATVSRTVQPQMYQYLYDLSRADGADPTRAADTGTDAARNGEPEGELGLITQKDSGLWQDQTGAPSDPQPGNIPGGRRDVLRSADFNDGSFSAFAPDSGTWSVSGGVLHVSATGLGGDAVSVFNHDQYLPVYFEIVARVRAEKPTAGWNANAYVIFDYFSPTDFKFAGINVSTNKFEMGYRDATGWKVVAQVPVQVRFDTWYDMLVVVHGSTVTVVIDGTSYFTYTFPARLLDGMPVGLSKGMIGVGSNNARGMFDNIAVQVLPPQITLDATESFDDGVADAWTPQAGSVWSVVGGRYVGTAPAGTTSMALQQLGDVETLNVHSYVEFTATLRTTGIGGIVFDRYAADDFKFVALDVPGQRVLIGHHSPRGGWVIDRAIPWVLSATADHVLTVTLKGASVTVTLNGVFVASHGFNAAVIDGRFGVLSRGGTTSVDTFRVRTDDPVFSGYTPPAPPPPAPATPVVTVVATDAVAAETSGALGEYEVHRTGDLTAPLTVTVAWSGTAGFGVDYTVAAVSGGSLSADGTTLTFAAGSATVVIRLTPLADAIAEPTESAVLSVVAASGYDVGTPASATVNIADDPPPPPPPSSNPSVSVGDATVTEGDRGNLTVSVLVTLSAPSTSSITVTLATADGTAIAKSDYQAKSQTLTFAPGTTSMTFTVSIVNDRKAEPTEYFFVNVTATTGPVTVADGQGLVTIIDNDGALTTATTGAGGSGTLTLADAQRMLDIAIAQWIAAGADPAQFAAIRVEIADLPGGKLADTLGSTIVIDASAAGWGWFVDPTPGSDEEFTGGLAWVGSPAEGRIDLLTVLRHEIGHVLGFEHADHGIMGDALSPGVRVALCWTGHCEAVAAPVGDTRAPVRSAVGAVVSGGTTAAPADDRTTGGPSANAAASAEATVGTHAATRFEGLAGTRPAPAERTAAEVLVALLVLAALALAASRRRAVLAAR